MLYEAGLCHTVSASHTGDGADPVVSPLGTGAFAPGRIIGLLPDPWDVAAGDLDGDGRAEVAAASMADDTVAIWRNVGGGEGVG